MLERIKTYINDRYGSRRGLFNHFKFGVQHRLGQFSAYRQVDWVRVNRLIFICHGNICRSPLAEYVARAKGIAAESFGLHCGEQFPADPRAVQFGVGIGLDLSVHRSRNISSYIPLESDLLVVMEPKHLEGAVDASANIAQITIAGLWLGSPNPYIHDPFSSGIVFFEHCESMVVGATQQIMQGVPREVEII